jgi:hypothetical protein
MRKTMLLGIIIIGLSLSGIIVSAWGLASLTIHSNGSMSNLQAYTTDTMTTPVTTILWDTISANETYTQTIWLRNTGDTSLILNMTIATVSPSYSFSYMDVTWDREGVVIGPKTTLSTTITLNTFENATEWPSTNGDFSHDLIFNGDTE